MSPAETQWGHCRETSKDVEDERPEESRIETWSVCVFEPAPHPGAVQRTSLAVAVLFGGLKAPVGLCQENARVPS
jgi:hypothetical protein